MTRFAALVLGLIVAACLAAPLYADHVAGRGPTETAVTDRIDVDGEPTDVVSPKGVPIGPGWRKEYLLGADQLGRDVMVRMLYGGRNSLFVGAAAALITLALAVLLGLFAGYFRGFTDRAISGLFDVMWSFPVLLFAIGLGTALATDGLDLGFAKLEGGSIWIATVIIGVACVPYLGRPVRGQVLLLREREFVEAAVAQGMGPLRVMFGEILPNLRSTLVVFATLIVANNILLETGLSFLGAGIQPPEPSWGNLVGDGADRIVTAPHLALVPGGAIALTVVMLNFVGDGLQGSREVRAEMEVR